MYSKYLNTIQIQEQPRELIKGGVPIVNLIHANSGVKGGTKHENSIQKIRHLSIPVGLIIAPTHKNTYTPKYVASITTIERTEDETPELINDTLFHKLYHTTIYQTDKTGRHAKTKRSSKRSSKRTTRKTRH